jgi:2-(1,2-epoxy-1,2-dihydrophenyl)acetyl-CoA isomerase
MTTIEQTIRMEQDGAVLTITINRPDSLNAFDRVTTERLAAALRTAERDTPSAPSS